MTINAGGRGLAIKCVLHICIVLGMIEGSLRLKLAHFGSLLSFDKMKGLSGCVALDSGMALPEASRRVEDLSRRAKRPRYKQPTSPDQSIDGQNNEQSQFHSVTFEMNRPRGLQIISWGSRFRFRASPLRAVPWVNLMLAANIVTQIQSCQTFYPLDLNH